ncbi:MAG: hypothetical protein JO102_06395, partial [Elusimicrobia bacterium]|nr:hypothetical protein [Elusimicrobiota bacterium]
MTSRQKKIRAATFTAAVIIILLLLHRCGPGRRAPAPPPPAPRPPVAKPSETKPPEVTAPPKPTEPPKPKMAEISPDEAPLSKVVLPYPSGVPRPHVTLHHGLLPKGVKITKISMSGNVAAPGEAMEFDIEGVGFTEDVAKDLAVRGGRDGLVAGELAYVSPKKIHGRLAATADAETGYGFPTVGVGESVIFQSTRPYAVIRPDEVLGFAVTKMDAKKHDGRFRLFTNLSRESFSNLQVQVSSPEVRVTDLWPTFPYLVDGDFDYPADTSGKFGVSASVGDNIIWEKPDAITIHGRGAAAKPVNAPHPASVSGPVSLFGASEGYFAWTSGRHHFGVPPGTKPPVIAKAKPPAPTGPGAPMATTAKPPTIPLPIARPPTAPPPPSAPSGEAAAARPKVELHPELIPKDIHIVRVYYASMIGAPGGRIEFDINGSGFNKEFRNAITVQSGRPDVSIENLKLVTPNQIHGTLVISKEAKTSYAFPTVSIAGTPVFQAPEPFAAIRPGEVLNLVFTEMGETGRTGRFRVFTNLDRKSFAKFRVEASTPTIDMSALRPTLPFIVDGTVIIGPAVTGNYGVKIMLGQKQLWSRDGIIRIVRPNLGETGLVLQLVPEDVFHRPGDTARFLIQGSGFQGRDVSALTAAVRGMKKAASKFTFMAPGRMALDLQIPSDAAAGDYELSIRNGDQVLLDIPGAFRIVPPNWVRSIRAAPPLAAGGTSQLQLAGRDLDAKVIQSIQVDVDEKGLHVGPFSMVDERRAVAEIKADKTVPAGDYQIRMRTPSGRVLPQNGDIIRVD